jgi:hypothetical protein
LHIFILSSMLFFVACTGSKKYFKAAERLEKQGLVSDAADYYLESLQRKPSNVQARLKLKEVGQKHVSNMASEFFRNNATQQLDATLDSYERLKQYVNKTNALNVNLDYPRAYDDDYQKAVDLYLEKNYVKAYSLVNQKKFTEALANLTNIKKYNANYKTSQKLEITSVCEPLYQNAITSLQSKNYDAALNYLSTIKSKTESYKDSKDLLELSMAQQTKSFILFQPKNKNDKEDKEVEDFLFNNFNQLATQNFTKTKIINNTPFTQMPIAENGSRASNIDLIQAIQKATGADYFYEFEIQNAKETNSGLQKTPGNAYLEVKTRKNDTLTITEYKQLAYNAIKASRTFSYQFLYKLTNAYTNQIVSSQTQPYTAQDAIEYNEFVKTVNDKINLVFPYNPQQTAAANQYNPRNWRGLFSAKNTLKPVTDLKNELYEKNLGTFGYTINNFVK